MASADMSIGPRLDWINRFSMLHSSVDRNVRESCGLNITQSRILFYVATHEPRPIGSVGKALFFKPSTTTAAATPLVKRGYLSRSHDELDRRTVYANITEKGKAITPSYIPAVRKAFEQDCPLAFEDKRDELRALLLPPSSDLFFGTDEDGIAAAAARIARDLNLDQSQDEAITHITRVLVIESISCFLAKMAEFDSSLDLTSNEARLLRALGNNNKGMRVKEASACINIRANVASLAIRNLTDRGLVDRPVLREDRRSANLKLTRKGARLVRDTRDELCEIFDSCFPTGLCEREVSEFFAV